MSPARTIVPFFLLSALIFCLLTIPWPGPFAGPAPHLMNGYRWVFRSIGDGVFARVGRGGSARFEPMSDETHERDTLVHLRNRLSGKTAAMEFKILYAGYRPTAFLIALILATPIPWRRRLLALLWGVLLVCVFAAFRTWIQLVDVFSGASGLAVYELGATTQMAVKVLLRVFIKSPAVGYIVPAVIWMLATLRREDWARFGMRLDSTPRSAKVAPARR